MQRKLNPNLGSLPTLTSLYTSQLANTLKQWGKDKTPNAQGGFDPSQGQQQQQQQSYSPQNAQAPGPYPGTPTQYFPQYGGMRHNGGGGRQ